MSHPLSYYNTTMRENAFPPVTSWAFAHLFKRVIKNFVGCAITVNSFIAPCWANLSFVNLAVGLAFHISPHP